MASVDCNQENFSWNAPGYLRILARIRNFTKREQELRKSSLCPWISVQKPQGEASETVTLSFGDQSASQKESCQVHYCYDHDEDTVRMYTREIKPLISGVFDGRNATVVAYGAIGSGKTHTIQGSEEKPGLAMLAIDEIIATAERLGKLVTISLYEIYQEHAYDLLNPERPAVMVLEDARGRIQLKGLSQAPIKSVSEFCKTYLSASSTRKAILMPETVHSRRSHKGLIVHLFTPSSNSEASYVSKLNFVDLAGYEDPRRKRSDGTKILENNLLNKSLYALQKVVLALNASGGHVPFRESKLTRMLQDSLGGMNRLILIACLNPSFCQDSIYMATLASRTCQRIHQSIMDSTKKTKSSNRVAAFSSGKATFSVNTSANMRMQTGSRMHVLQKKVSGTPVIKGKKLFDEASNWRNYTKATSTSSVSSAVETETLNEPYFTVAVPLIAITSPLEGEKTYADAIKETTHLEEMSQDASQENLENQVDHSSDAKCTIEALSLSKEDDTMDKANSSSSNHTVGSPPICARLREISNNLKLVESTPTSVPLPQQSSLPYECEVSAEPKDFEPVTPMLESGRENERPYLNMPQEVSKTCYCGSKNSLVQEYLRFVNSASKEELKGLKGIGEKRATYILKLREESPEPFKSLDDLKGIGLSTKQIKRMLAMK